MSRSFAKPALSRTVTSKTNNQLYQLKILSLFKIIPPWLEKFNELRSIWRSAPPPIWPATPPLSLSSTCWFLPFSGRYILFPIFFSEICDPKQKWNLSNVLHQYCCRAMYTFSRVKLKSWHFWQNVENGGWFTPSLLNKLPVFVQFKLQ